MSVVFVFLLIAILAGWVALAVRRERITLEEMYSRPEFVRRLWSIHLPTTKNKLILFIVFCAVLRTIIFFSFPSAEQATADIEKQQTIVRRIEAQDTPELKDEKAKRDAQKKEVERIRGLLKPEDFGNGGLKEMRLKQEEATLKMFDDQVAAAQSIASRRANQEAQKETSGATVAGGVPAFIMPGVGFLMLSLAGMVILRRKNRGHVDPKNGYQGSAKWAKWSHINLSETHRWLLPVWASYVGTTKRWSLSSRFFGGIGMTFYAPPEGDAVNTHFLLLGGTGSGKGFSIFNHILMNSKTPSIYQDGKSECPCIMQPRWKNAIRWGCAADGGWPSMRWNPLAECFADPEPEDALMTLAAAVIPDPENAGEGDWVTKLARPIMVELLMTRQWNTLGEFADAILGMPLAELVDTFELPRGRAAILEGKNSKEYVAGTLDSQLYGYRLGWGRVVTSGHDFTLDQLIEKGGYILSVETEQTRKNPLQLMWYMIFRKLRRSARPRPVNILLDEAMGAGKIPQVMEALAELRSRKVSIWMGWQDPEQIQKVYGQVAAKGLYNSFGNRIHLVHGISPDAAKRLSEESGNWSKDRGGHAGLGLGMSGPSLNLTSGTDDQTATPLFTQTEILNRSRSSAERWAVIFGREATKNGDPILCMMQGSSNAWNRQPSPEEAAEELARYRSVKPAAPVPEPPAAEEMAFAGAAPAPVDVNDLGW
jgi:type IV secretory pathway TraG/TraD family ATPase VirD4